MIITDRDELEAEVALRNAELQASEKRLRLALEAGRHGSWSVNLDTGWLTASDGCKAICGRAPGEPLSLEELRETIHPDDRALQKEAMEKAIAQGTLLDAEYRLVLSSGEERWVQIRGQAHYRADGTPLLITGTTQDITDRRRAQSHPETEGLTSVAFGGVERPGRISFRPDLFFSKLVVSCQVPSPPRASQQARCASIRDRRSRGGDGTKASRDGRRRRARHRLPSRTRTGPRTAARDSTFGPPARRPEAGRGRLRLHQPSVPSGHLGHRRPACISPRRNEAPVACPGWISKSRNRVERLWAPLKE